MSASTAPELTSDVDLPSVDVLAETDHTQLRPGNPEVRGRIVSADRYRIGRMRLDPLFLGHTLLNPEWALLWIPLSWSGEYRFNGRSLLEPSVALVTGVDGYFTRGEQVDIGSIAIDRQKLNRDLATLAGVSPDELQLADGVLRLPLAAIRRLQYLVRVCTSRAEGWRPGELTRLLDEELLETLLLHSPQMSSQSRDQRKEKIVRRAEDYFMSAYPEQPSLLSLCQASGVGKNALYSAFQSLFDESPVSYFRKRRFSSARRALARSPGERGAVKRIALDSGFTEFGRFAVEYRLLFGELPSDTAGKKF